ncbi:MAG: YkgJ family cysteine cluster protein [Ignisphaera sp.]
MNFDAKQIHFITKKALKDDMEAAEIIIEFLSDLEIKEAIATAYLIVYQIAMNVFLDLGEECKKCGGTCCKTGSAIELMDFDINELIESGADIAKLVKLNRKYYIPRPCPFQDGWKCAIHKSKPYSCLSYPFAVEDIQKDIIASWFPPNPLKPFIPDFCVAGKKAWYYIESAIHNFKNKYGRTPTPQELLQYLRNHKQF